MTILTISKNTVGTYIGDTTGVTDTYLTSAPAGGNYGTSANFYLGDLGTYTGLIKFDVSSIPAGSTINSVTLYLYRTLSTNPSLNFDLHKALLAWTEGGATWNLYDGTNAWNTAGALGDGTDRSATVSGTITIGNGFSYYSVSSAGMAADVTAWLSGGNNGWVIVPPTTTASDYRVCSTSEDVDGQRPALVIDYTAPASGAPSTPKTRVVLEYNRRVAG